MISARLDVVSLFILLCKAPIRCCQAFWSFLFLGPLVVHRQTELAFGFGAKEQRKERRLEFDDLYGESCERSPGLNDDKLKAVLHHVAKLMIGTSIRGIIFAYDEAQNLSDHAASKEYPVSLLLDVFSYFQRTLENCHFMLVLTGLPTLFPQLNAARTYTERMFHVMYLERLSDEDARDAIQKPIEITQRPLRFAERTINNIIELSAGYPYFIQFACKEVFDTWIGRIADGLAPSVPTQQIVENWIRVLRPWWQRATDRQQDFMKVVATLESGEDEFSVQEIVAASKDMLKKDLAQVIQLRCY